MVCQNDIKKGEQLHQTIIIWMDNNADRIVSSFAGEMQKDKVKRWDLYIEYKNIPYMPFLFYRQMKNKEEDLQK